MLTYLLVKYWYNYVDLKKKIMDFESYNLINSNVIIKPESISSLEK